MNTKKTKQGATSAIEPSMKRLREISELMNDEDLSLEDALKLYGEASELVSSCKAQMKEAQLALREIFIGAE
ncbi:MAG: exodeoxyribonuclease VII small subunit [Oscillospiraceae bacterium]|nr:exodeoxyribonuclease VII small subunit [Oscillospiraceae bacterium]